jgi:negative regulator of sigma-B (phosphoserine phosphatase)
MEEMRSPFVEWGIAALPLAGQEQCGDAYAAKAWKKKFLAAAIDGLGHGRQAAIAAGIAVDTLTRYTSDSDDVISLVKRCHQSLLGTRGVVLSLALFDVMNNAMTWVGVGNVDGLLVRADPQTKPASESLFRRGGVVGYQLPPLRPSTLRVNRGDLIIFSTDGICSAFSREVCLQESPQQIADMVIKGYNRKTDDALVMVVRYNGDLT